MGASVLSLGDARPDAVPFGGTVSEASEAELLVFESPDIVVMRCACVVSSDGGGGSEDRSGSAGKRKARQRKHSPVP